MPRGMRFAAVGTFNKVDLMAESKSIYSRGGSGMTTGGLDGYLGPEAGDFSNLPDHIEEPAVMDDMLQVDCDGADKAEMVCQIAEAEKKLKDISQTAQK